MNRNDGPSQPIDLAAAMERFDGDLPFFRTLLGEFISVMPDRLRLLEEAAGRDDREQLRNIAHGIRGAAGNLGAGTVSELARELEGLGAASGLPNAAGPLKALRREIARIERYAGAFE